jgi:hypothetical protein
LTNSEHQDLIAFLGRKFGEIDCRFDRMDAKLAEHDERFREVLGHFDEGYRRLERLEDEYHAIVQGLRIPSPIHSRSTMSRQKGSPKAWQQHGT